MAVSATHKGWRLASGGGRLAAYFNGTLVFDFDANDLTIPAGITFDISAATLAGAAASVTAAMLGANLRTGTIDLPLTSWRITDNANTNYGLVAATAVIGSGGVGGIDGEPSLTRVNAGTDPTARLVWLDAKLDPILNDFTLPADCDASAALTFKVLAGMSGTNNATTTLTLDWRAVGPGAYAAGANQGSASTAFAASANLVVKSFTIAAAAINAPGNHVSVSLTPDSPGTDAMHMYGSWVEYTRKT